MSATSFVNLDHFNSRLDDVYKHIADAKCADLKAQVICTIKTHKEPGEVAVGCIHASPKMGLAGLSSVGLAALSVSGAREV